MMFNEELSEEEVILIKKKVQAHYETKVPMHVVYKGGIWKNGHVTEVSAEFFILDDFLEGKMAIFFQEVYSVSSFKRSQT